MTNEEMDAIAKDVNTVTAELAKIDVLKTASHQGAAMGLALGAAHHVIHGGGTFKDFMNLAEAAWAKAKKNHATSCG